MDNINFEELANELQEITEKLKNISDFENKLTSKYGELSEHVKSLNIKIENFSKEIEKINYSFDLDKVEKSFEVYVEKMENISKSFAYQIQEAKNIQNQIMMEKMDLLISKAEKLAPSYVQEEKKTKQVESIPEIKEKRNNVAHEIEKDNNKEIAPMILSSNALNNKVNTGTKNKNK